MKRDSKSSKKMLKSLEQGVNSKKAGTIKGGSRVVANAHEMKKALISNFPR